MPTTIRKSDVNLLMINFPTIAPSASNQEGLQNPKELFPHFYMNSYVQRSKTNVDLMRIKKVIESILSSHKIPYNQGKAYYYLDQTSKKVKIFIPVNRLTGEVGIIILELLELLEKKIPGWHIDILAKINHDIDTWGVAKKQLIETVL